METELDEKAHEYALKNASRFINKTLAEAYIAGYKAGFKDCEDNILISLPKKDIEYVDLGLPSGTLWSSDYCLIDNDFDIMAFCNHINLIKMWTILAYQRKNNGKNL